MPATTFLSRDAGLWLRHALLLRPEPLRAAEAGDSSKPVGKLACFVGTHLPSGTSGMGGLMRRALHDFSIWLNDRWR